MKTHEKWILGSLLTLLAISLATEIFTRKWADSRVVLRAADRASAQSGVDYTQPFGTAQQLAPLAVTHSEQEDAQDALRLGDHAVDMAFADALRDATENPAPLTKETRALAARIQTLEDAAVADEESVAELKEQVAKAHDSKADALQDRLDLAEAQLALDQDDLDDAHQDFIRAGGDKHATIQKLLDEYEAGQPQADASHPGAAIPTAPTITSAAANSSVELTKSDSIDAQSQAWLSLRSKEKLLIQARDSALADAASLSVTHDALEKVLTEEKTQKKILPKKEEAAAAAAAASHPPAGPSAERKSEPESSAPATEIASAPPPAASALSVLEHLSQDQRDLSEVDKRIVNEQQLAAAYSNWLIHVDAREKFFLHGIFRAIFWILLIALLVFIANYWIQRFFEDLARERRDLHAMGTVILLVIQALGLVLILLVVFGVPSNFATLVAFAGAGLTVAMKDFILGFMGWFILMGKDGIRPGDWVEINGIGGEVLEVGPFHTVLLETGKWSDAAHPTGRKVSLMNSFAIEGQYFNFSTSGQWLWDEIQIQVSQDADPYLIAEAIKKIATDETAANAQKAGVEWGQAVPAFAKRTFSAEPSMSVRPSGAGASVLVRYITRVNERQDVRARIYRGVVELLRSKNLPESSASPTPAPAK
jgi:small-conductance mechanosensitive channel